MTSLVRFVQTTLICAAVAVAVSGCSHRNNSMQQSKAQLHAYALAESDIQQGISYMNAGNMSLAKAKLENAVSVAPNLPKAQYTWGYYQLKAGDAAAAKKAYDKSLSIAPGDPEVLNSYGIYLCKTGQYKASIDYFLKAAKHPDFRQVGLAYQNAGLCAAHIPDDQQAEMYLERAIQHNMQLSIAYLRLANLYFMRGDYAKSSDYLHRFNQLAKPTAESEQLEQQLAEINAKELATLQASEKVKMQKVQKDLQAEKH